ncbi:MAG: peptidoglycan-binding protein [Candidatus Pacebacteria bacterium]|nr:peptidoglycan-binding protein [Candidatus Paceibacterota bacterium]MBP9866576.1 peptidoglycan-binding protein [Candidatus Paceibacterota bacterium]
MKNNIIRLVVVSAFLPMLAFAETVTDTVSDQIDCVVITHALKLGSRDANTGGDVTTLQTYLSQANFLDADPTGYFGRATKKAVQDFQRANNITPLGSVGPYTRTKIKEISCTDSNTNTTSVNTTPVVNTNTQVVANPSATVNTATNQVTTNTATIQANTQTQVFVPAIVPTPIVTNNTNSKPTILYPNGGEVLNYGQSTWISWTPDTYTGSYDVSIRGVSSGNIYNLSQNVQSRATDKLSVAWTPTANSYEKDTVFVARVCKSGTQICAESASNFTIPNSYSKPVILYPNNGEILQSGITQYISWTPQNSSGSFDVAIIGVYSENEYWIKQNVSNAATDKLSVSWIPTAGLFEKDSVFKVRVCITGTSICGESQNNFTVKF